MEHFLGVEQSYVKTFFCLKKKKTAKLLPAHISENTLSVEKKTRVNKIKKRIVNGKFVLSRRCQILQIESSLIET